MKRRDPSAKWLLTIVFGAFLAARCDGPTSPSSQPGALTIACPPSQTAQATVGQTAAIVYPAPTANGGTAPVAISCTPASGSAFPLGDSKVMCVGTDARRLTSSCTFAVTVTASAPRIATTRFVAFGDSITEGKNASGELVANNYPALLQVMLANRYTAQTVVVMNRGRSAEMAGGGVSRLPGILDADNPDVLLLLEGVNDLAGGDPSAISPMVDALRQMVRQARSRGVQVLLATLLPERAGGSPDRSGALPLITAANDQIRQLATLEGATLVDLNQGFAGSPDPFIGADGLHPNEGGYQKIAELYFNAIRARFELAQIASLQLPR